jgi:hypothetical protein
LKEDLKEVRINERFKILFRRFEKKRNDEKWRELKLNLKFERESEIRKRILKNIQE